MMEMQNKICLDEDDEDQIPKFNGQDTPPTVKEDKK